MEQKGLILQLSKHIGNVRVFTNLKNSQSIWSVGGIGDQRGGDNPTRPEIQIASVKHRFLLTAIGLLFSHLF